MRYGGRQKGTPNKRTLALQERLASMDCDPIEAMVRIAKQAKADKDWHLVFAVNKELAQYVYPKRKAIEVYDEGPEEKREIEIRIVGVASDKDEASVLPRP
jgi:hypothetical protein